MLLLLLLVLLLVVVLVLLTMLLVVTRMYNEALKLPVESFFQYVFASRRVISSHWSDIDEIADSAATSKSSRTFWWRI